MYPLPEIGYSIACKVFLYTCNFYNNETKASLVSVRHRLHCSNKGRKEGLGLKTMEFLKTKPENLLIIHG
jgi:hypothetical protein